MNETRLTGWQAAVTAIISAGLGVIIPSESFTGTALSSRLFCVALLCVPFFITLATFKMTGQESFPSAVFSVLPRRAARVLFFLLGLYFIVQATLRLSNGCRLINLFLLPQTPREAVLLLIIACAPVLFYSGLRRLSTLGELTAVILALPIVFLTVIGFAHIDRVKLMELSNSSGISPREVVSAARSFHGICVFVFCIGTARLSAKGHRGIFYSYLTAALFSLLAFVICTGMFSTNGAGALLYPINEAYRVLSIGTLELSERYDLLLLIIQLAAVIMGTAILMYCAGYSLAVSFSLQSHRSLVLPLLPAVFTLSYAASRGELMLLDAAGDAGFFAVMLLVLPILCVMCLLKEGRSCEKPPRAC